MQLQSVVIDTMILISNNFDISLCKELRIRGEGVTIDLRRSTGWSEMNGTIFFNAYDV